MFLSVAEGGSGRLAALGRGHQTDRARCPSARCEALHMPHPRSLHPLRPPCDARPEHPQLVPLTIGALPLLRWQVSLIRQLHRPGEPQRSGTTQTIARLHAVAEMSSGARVGAPQPRSGRTAACVLPSPAFSRSASSPHSGCTQGMRMLGGGILAYAAHSTRTDQACMMGPPSRRARWPRRRRDLLRLGSAAEKNRHVAGCAVCVKVVW